jgi:hypothetical protein
MATSSTVVLCVPARRCSAGSPSDRTPVRGRVPVIVATRGLMLAERSRVQRATVRIRSATGVPVSTDQVWVVAAKVRALP